MSTEPDITISRSRLIELQDAEVERNVLRAAIDAALEFAGTVAPGAAWWDDVWAEHEVKIAKVHRAKQ